MKGLLKCFLKIFQAKICDVLAELKKKILLLNEKMCVMEETVAGVKVSRSQCIYLGWCEPIDQSTARPPTLVYIIYALLD